MRLTRALLLGACALVVSAAPGFAQLLFDGNILWDNYSNGVLTNIERTAAQPAAITTHQLYFHYTHNDSVNPMLIDPNSHTNPNFVPAPGSPAIGGIDDVVDPVINARECDAQSCTIPADWAQIERVCYRGAVPPAAMGQDWTQGWTYYNDTGAGR
ncbi:MAG TPA: hypothetical protein VNM87_14255, partial [Candidatus Udaeobacter sp.]|nr:hypothetical protein [Candidatus Udaeobacter sp.]